MTPPDQRIFKRAIAALQSGALTDAEREFVKFLRKNPKHFGALNLYGIVLTRLARYEEAEAVMRRAIDVDGRSDATFHNYGLVLKALNRGQEALTAYGKAIAINPSAAETWNSRGTALHDLGRFQEAIDDFDKALSLNSHFVEALLNRGRALVVLKRFDEALASVNQTLAINPKDVEAWVIRGNSLTSAAEYGEALASYAKALALQPDHVLAWKNRGSVLYELSQFEAALECFDRALQIMPDHAEVVCNRGFLLFDIGRYDEAIDCFKRMLALSPDWKFLPGRLLLAKMFICDWSDFDRDSSQLISALRAGHPVTLPFVLMEIPASADDQFACTRMLAAERVLPSFNPISHEERYAHDRIRVAYLSADFREHAVSYLMAGVYEQHDRSRFEIYAISLAAGPPTAMLARMQKAFDLFVDASGKSDREVAAMLREMEIDIAVDLMGYTQNSRSGIFVRRSAPIQLNYLGYAGTMGEKFWDYIVADQFVIPAEDRDKYAEKVAYLPDSFMANDNSRIISAQSPSRFEAGLPESGFVFCCFNNSYKFTPDAFDVWMRLLRQIDGSVLWLSASNTRAMQNLLTEADKRGVSSERLIFAPRVASNEDHLARMRLADLFLDTLYYNAHTTAADALWVGLPIITHPGQTFSSRVAGSLLNAIGLCELIAPSIEAYEALALKLAREPAMLAEIKAKLVRNRDTFPLFDTVRFTRHIEAAYTTMWKVWQRGEAPESFAVPRLS